MRGSLWFTSALAVAAQLFLSPQLEAQIGERLRRGVTDRVNQAAEGASRGAGGVVQGVEDAANQTLDRIECRIDNQACIADARARGAHVTVTDATGAPVAGGAAVAMAPGEGSWTSFDFVPGSRILFAEDFSGTRRGDFPRRLEFIQGSMIAVDSLDNFWLKATSKSAFAIQLDEVLPDRFTMEMDVTLPYNGMVIYFAPREGVNDRFLFNGQWEHPFIVLSHTEVGIRMRPHTGGAVVEPPALFGRTYVFGELVRLRIDVDGTYGKVYLNEHQVANIPNVRFPRTDRVFIEVTGEPDAARTRSHELIPTLIGAVTIAADAGPLRQALAAEGRVSTQGINFDVGSDRIRPESTPTLTEIGSMLRADPSLRLGIVGHTDATGDERANQDLSRRRAEAVRQFLVSSMGIEESRLEASGQGSSEPVAANDTPEGRLANRRVELVRR